MKVTLLFFARASGPMSASLRSAFFQPRAVSYTLTHFALSSSSGFRESLLLSYAGSFLFSENKSKALRWLLCVHRGNDMVRWCVGAKAWNEVTLWIRQSAQGRAEWHLQSTLYTLGKLQHLRHNMDHKNSSSEVLLGCLSRYILVSK